MNQNYNLMRLANLYGGMNKYAIDTSPMLIEGAIASGRDINKLKFLLESNASGLGGVTPEQAAEARKLLDDPLLERKFNSVLNEFDRRTYSDTLPEVAKIDPSRRSDVINKTVAAGNTNPVISELSKLSPEAQNKVIEHQLNQDPSTWESIKNWITANPGKSTAIGAGALGLGGLGAYYALKDDEEEERKKSASLLPDTALTSFNNPLYQIAMEPKSQYPGSITLDPSNIAEALKKEPLPGYTFGTEDQAMQRFNDELAKDPTLLEKIKAWMAANPGKSYAIGAGALGLGGLGAYAMMNNDDEEEKGRKKTAGYIDPYVAQVLAHDYITKMASANGIPTVAAGVTGLSNYLNLR